MKKVIKNTRQSYVDRLEDIVNSKLKGDSPWPLAHQSFLSSATKFLEVQRHLKENFDIKICFKEAILHQIKEHGLYRREKVDATNLPRGSIFCSKQYMQKDIFACSEVIDILSELGKGPSLDSLKADIQLRKIFFTGERKEQFIYSDYLDEGFFSALERHCGPKQTKPLITKGNLTLMMSKMRDSEVAEINDAITHDLSRR